MGRFIVGTVKIRMILVNRNKQSQSVNVIQNPISAGFGQATEFTIMNIAGGQRKFSSEIFG